MTRLHLAVAALLVATLAVSACGRKNDPSRPGQEPEQQEPL